MPGAGRKPIAQTGDRLWPFTFTNPIFLAA